MDPVEHIANTVLYEGYLLYPYRASALKNRQRWNFGVVAPGQSMETQCLALGDSTTRLSVKVRCLRLVDRVAGAPKPAACIEVNGQIYESWQEASECEMELSDLDLRGLAVNPVDRLFTHPATNAVENLAPGATLTRTQQPLDCRITAAAQAIEGGPHRLSIRIENVTPPPAEAPAQALLGAHTILRIRSGEFVSMLETPPEFAAAAALCNNTGTWPVLAGEPGARDTILSSPIILYDYPQVAPESPGDLFDGGEIDEILSLRILTLTDGEKTEMRRTDPRARHLLERTESLPVEHLLKLHGRLRTLPPRSSQDQETA